MELPLEIYISTSMVRTAYQINLLKPESIRGLFGNSAFTYLFYTVAFSFLETLITTLLAYSSENIRFVCLQKIVTFVTTSLSVK